MVGELSNADHIRQTHIRLITITDYELYFNAIDQDHESGDAIINGYNYKINTPQFTLVHRSKYGNSCDFKHQFFEYPGNNCYIRTKRYCFVKCINFITDEDYKQQYLGFIRKERTLSNIMTKARIQPFCRANNNNLGYFDGIRVFLSY